MAAFRVTIANFKLVGVDPVWWMAEVPLTAEPYRDAEAFAEARGDTFRLRVCLEPGAGP